jgi:hypothetical protein
MNANIEQFVALIKGKKEVELNDKTRSIIQPVIELCHDRFQYLGDDTIFRYRGHMALIKVDATSIKIFRKVDQQCLVEAMKKNARSYREDVKARESFDPRTEGTDDCSDLA